VITVAIAGINGRMGRVAYDAVSAADGVSFAGGFARERDDARLVYDDLAHLFEERKPDVLLDFTTYPKSIEVSTDAVLHRVSPVIGASGWTGDDRTALAELAAERRVGALLVPNFALGAMLMMRFAREAARYFPTSEIVELHHDQKRDKPSATSQCTADAIRAGGGPSDVPIHSVRLRGLVAHQEVLFGNTGETLTVRHDCLSRDCFGAGIVAAVLCVQELDGLQVGLEHALQ